MAAEESEADKLQNALRDTRPGWLTDGNGIRGPQPDQPRSLAGEDTKGSVRREPKQGPFPPEESSGGGASGEPVDMYGADQGEPMIFHLIQSEPTTPVPP